MQHHVLRTRVHHRVLFALVLVLACATAGAGAGALPIDEAVTAVTCSDLVQAAADAAPDELGGALDLSYCHSQSDAVVCAPPGTDCATTAEEDAGNGTVKVDVTGVAAPGGVMFLSVGKTGQTHACGQPLYLGVSIRFESEGVSDLLATHRVSKALDQEHPQNGAGNIGICYDSPKPFTDADGNLTFSGLLGLCDENGDVPPCISHRHKNKADAIVKLRLPSGDPVWKMVEDTLDRGTG